jgi:hypothetical protein
MFDTIEERASTLEQYGCAVGSSNLRVGNDPTIRTPGDMIAAAGMNKHRTGLALRRLMTEWDKSAIPRQPTTEQVAQIEMTYVREPEGEEHAGLVWDRNKVAYRRPREMAQEEAARWYANELHLLAVSLRGLPAVRDALIYEFGDAHVVGKVLEWWLAKKKCKQCGGRKERLIAGTNHLSGKPCKPCRGTGEEDPPHGDEGQAIAAHIGACLSAAARDLREGGSRVIRTSGNSESREDAAQADRAYQHHRHSMPEMTPERRAEVTSQFQLGKRTLTRPKR